MVISIADGVRAAVPLEIGWGLAAPFAGPKAKPLVNQLAQMWAENRHSVDALIVSGIPGDGVFARAVLRKHLDTEKVGIGEQCIRRFASLDGGLDGFFSRRSPDFGRTSGGPIAVLGGWGDFFLSTSTKTPTVPSFSEF